MPMAGAFAKTYAGPEHTAVPLRFMWCEDCRLAQTGERVDPNRLFRDYSYRSSTSRPLVEHFSALADAIGTVVRKLVVDVGCNDGILIRPLRALGVNAIGVDPSDVAHDAAMKDGWPLVNEYLDESVAKAIVSEHGHASVVVASNVFAHTENVHSLCEAVRILLDDDGMFICEVHYLGSLLEGCQFDTIYHEHVLYYSLRSLGKLLAMHSMRICGVEDIDTHAGSVRVYAQLSHRVPNGDESIDVHIEHLPPVEQFAHRATHARDIIREAVAGIAQKRQVWAYGAAGRCTILLNWCLLGPSVVSRVIDASPRRIGRLVPGTRTPIRGPDELSRGTCGAMLVTAWNYFDAIKSQHPDPYMWWIKPLPELTVL